MNDPLRNHSCVNKIDVLHEQLKQKQWILSFSTKLAKETLPVDVWKIVSPETC